MPAPEENVEIIPKQQEIPVREITQTDHLNKKLLTSLFNRMNQDGDSILDKLSEDENKKEPDEWND